MDTRAALSRSFQYALVIFILTALIGLANATKVFGELDENTLITHLHSGTLGWITLGILTVTAWLFGAASAQLGRYVIVTAAATAAYVLTFWWGNFPVRALFGAIELLVIFAWWAWVLRRSLSEGLSKISNPKLAILLGLTTVVIGSTAGVIVDIQTALGPETSQTGALISMHAGAQTAGYLLLVATGIIEWLLVGERRTRGGTVQSTLLFLAGLAIALGTLLSVQPLLLITNVLQIAATVMVLVRLGPAILRTAWGAAGAARHAAVVVLYLVIGVVLLVALVQQVIAQQGDISKVSPGLLHSLDHTFFIGVSTNALFAAVLALTKDRMRVWPWADHLVFWGLNLGALSFTAVLVFVGSSAGTAPFAHPVAYTASLMGLAALLAIGTYLRRLSLPPEVAAPAGQAAPS